MKLFIALAARKCQAVLDSFAYSINSTNSLALTFGFAVAGTIKKFSPLGEKDKSTIGLPPQGSDSVRNGLQSLVMP